MSARLRATRSFTQSQYASVDPVFGGSRHLPRPVSAAPTSPHSSPCFLPAQCVRHRLRRPPAHAKAVVVKGSEHFGDRGHSMLAQVHRENVTKFGSPE